MPVTTARGVHYTYEDVDHRLTQLTLPGDTIQHAVYYLHPEDRAWNPASTKGELTGPGRLEYRRYTDGGITAELTEATTAPEFLEWLQKHIQDELEEEIRR
jgi:hypothetical protein